MLCSHTQVITKLETQIGQLATALSKREEGKLPSQPIENSRGQFMIESSYALEIFSENTKLVMTLRNGKVIKQISAKSMKPTPNL